MADQAPEEAVAEEQARQAEEDRLAAEALQAGEVDENEEPDSEDADEDGDGEGEPHKKQTAQERIDEITWKFREAERQANYWRGLANEEPRSSEQENEPANVSDRPVLENFETTVEYEDALFGWYDKKRVNAETVKSHTASVKKNIGIFNENAAEFKKTHKDFSKVIEAPVFTDTMRNVLFTMDGGPEVTYHIAKNPELGELFGKLSPEQQIFKIAELRNEIKLAHKTRTITGATDPIEPVGDTGQPDKDPDKMSTKEWMAWNKKRDLAMLEKKLGENK